jgi:CHAT domain-containing protein
MTAITDFSNAPDEALGFPAAFLYAGASGVVGTLWPVSEVATALAMERFHHFLRDQHLSPTASLHAAQRWLRSVTYAELADAIMRRRATTSDQASMPYLLARQHLVDQANQDPSGHPYADPYYWAAFTFHSDSGLEISTAV